MNVIDSTSDNYREGVSLYPFALSPKCLFSSVLSYCFRKYKMSLSDFPKLTVFSFSFWTSSEEMSLFVGPILHGHSGGYCRSLLQCKDRLKYNSHFSGSGFPPPHLTPFLSILMNINCLLNYYLVEMSIDSLHYSPLLFESLGHSKCSYSVLFLDFSLLSLPVYFYYFLIIFLF